MKNSLVKKLVTFVVVMLLPSLYLLIYLSAAWDPSARTNEIPVAIVNEDKGARIENTDENLGNEIINTIKGNGDLKWIDASSKEADEGIKEGRYYGALIIPENFTECIASAAGTDKVQGLISFKVNEKIGLTVSSSLKNAAEEIKRNISSEISVKLASTLVTKMEEIPSSMKTLEEGLDKLYKGSKQLSDSVGKLASGQDTLNEKLSSLKTGLTEMSKATVQLDDASGILSIKLQEFSTKLTEGTKKTGALSAGSAQYKAGLNSLSNNIVKMGSSAELAAVSKGLNQLKAAYSQLDSGLGSLVESLNSAAGYSSMASDGAAKLNVGIGKLSNGINTVSKGSALLAEGSGNILDGQRSVDEGLKSLSKVLGETKDKIENSSNLSEDSLVKLDGIAEYIAEPVKLDLIRINPLPNNGAGLTPMMLSIALWIGSLMLFISQDMDKKDPSILSGKASILFKQLTHIFVSIAQAVFAAIMLTVFMGLEVTNIGSFYLACIVASLCFTSVVQLFVGLLKDAGKILAILFMLLQMAASGGVFPIETAPAFYRAIYPYIPMVYSVKAFKDVISGIVYPDLSSYMLILGLIAVASFTVFITIMFIKLPKIQRSTAKIV